MTSFAAVDLGASSGRVVLGHVDAQRLEIEEIHRFANVPVSVSGTSRWDVLGLFRETLAGVSAAARQAEQLRLVVGERRGQRRAFGHGNSCHRVLLSATRCPPDG